MLLYSKGGPDVIVSDDDIREGIETLDTIVGRSGRILLVPPDNTRLHSQAGKIVQHLYQSRTESVKAIIPALGTHRPMRNDELQHMFGNVPVSLFREHRWRDDCYHAGTLSSEWMSEISDGAMNEAFPVCFNNIVTDPSFDTIISISQVVPHEVAGMAGYTKNIFVGIGGTENIHRSHYLGAVYGMEKIMGTIDSPVRKVFNKACSDFCSDKPVVHVITVMDSDESGCPVMRGLFVGTGSECYLKAAALSREVNVHLLDQPIDKVVVYLDPEEFKSTWLGNKSIYRTRMAIADGGELIIIAPAVSVFGEDEHIDQLIRTFGYRGTPEILHHVKKAPELAQNLSAAAHLIHGSSEGRFSITYAAGGLTKNETESVGYRYGDIHKLLKRYDPMVLHDGYSTLPDGETIYFISKPATGLWAFKELFHE